MLGVKAGWRLVLVGLLGAWVLTACERAPLTPPPTSTPFLTTGQRPSPTATPVGQVGRPSGAPSASGGAASYIPDLAVTLQTNIAAGRLAFVGVGGAVDGQVDPTIKAAQNAVLQVVLTNGDGVEHDIAFPDFNVHSEHVSTKGSSTSIVFRATKSGEFFYFCTVPGHRQAGMEGRLVVGGAPPLVGREAASIARDPTDLPKPIGARGPQKVRVDMEAQELEGKLAEGTTYTYWTFGGRVPGPFLRVRKGDSVELHLKNRADSKTVHSIDLHAVTGPGGGAAVMQVPPGQEKDFTFKALNPGLYVYHCATPLVAHHIANGMYGMILVEPESGLPPVDREFYVMQGEVYTQKAYGQRGPQEFSVEKLLAETPEYVVFNGSVGSLTQEYPLKANVGETVRLYMGVGGPNYTSAFHVIGEIFDRVYNQGSLTAPPLTDVQTTLVPPGGATVVEFKLEVPGRYILVDHALSRLERGLAGFLMVEGPPNTEVFKGEASSDSGSRGH